MESTSPDKKAVAEWAENWTMDHIDDQERCTREAWLKMLRSGNIVQPDKVTDFLVKLEQPLRGESLEAFGVGLCEAGVDDERAAEIVAILASRRT